MRTRAGHIVVGYDGSRDSVLALEWGAALAAGQGRSLSVLISEVDATAVLEATTVRHEQKMVRLRAAAEAWLRERSLEDADVELVAEPPTGALVAASARAATVVLGARGHSALTGVFLGSVSQEVTRHAVCPVVVIRPMQTPDADRVVVGVDGSPASRKALEFGFDHASRTGAALTAIHGWRNSGRSESHTLVEEIRVAERILAESLAGLSEDYPDVTVKSEAIPVAPQRVLTDASQSASLVVVGSRGLGAFAGLLLGSISQAVLHHAQCPVAVVR